MPAAPAPPKDSRPRASLTVEGEETGAVATPPYPTGMEKLAIRDRIVDNSAPIRECYEKRLVERPRCRAGWWRGSTSDQTAR